MKIFIVEDDAWYGEMLKYHLSLNEDNQIYLFETANECLDKLKEKPDFISIDYELPDMNGDELLKRIKRFDSGIPIIVISAQEDIQIALDVLNNGAYDYLIKGENTKDFLWDRIVKIKENKQLKSEIVSLKKQLESKNDFSKEIIGNSKAIKKVFTLIEKSLKTNINVSITGETGSGKELVAKAIHYNSERKKNPFIAINLSAIPKDLVESELFGHEKGAFTGANTMKKGKFEEANGGTILLDEIAELDENIQVKLLRVLQEREIVRVGGNKTIKFDVRIISATHKNLIEEVKSGNFRKDLYYRLIGLPIELPPLRERDSDIILLANHFVKNFAQENNLEEISLEKSAKDKLLKYRFPGNVRELKSVIELACVLCTDSKITSEDLNFNSLEDNIEIGSFNKTLQEYENYIISMYLEKYKDVVQVAKILSIGKSKIYNLIKEGKVNK